MCRGRRLAPGRRRTPCGPGSPSPRADAGGDSREHRYGSPHHAVREAAPLHVHDAAASTAKLLLVRLGRRRRLHFRHPGRGWQRRRQQEWRTPFRFRHAARAPLRPAPMQRPSLGGVTSGRWGPPGLAFPPGIGAASFLARPTSFCARQPRGFALALNRSERDSLRQRAV